MTAHRITLLTLPRCRVAEHAQAVLDRIARDVPLEVEQVPLDSDRGRALGAWVPFPPGILLDGKPFGFGRLSERLLRAALQTDRPGGQHIDPPRTTGGWFSDDPAAPAGAGGAEPTARVIRGGSGRSPASPRRGRRPPAVR